MKTQINVTVLQPRIIVSDSFKKIFSTKKRNVYIDKNGIIKTVSKLNGKTKYPKLCTKNNGYSNFSTAELVKRTTLVHRLVWETFMGEIPEGYEIDHINADPSDNRLNNLRLVTHTQNIRLSKKRTDYTRKKFSIEEKAIAKTLYKKGFTRYVIAKCLNRNWYSVHRILNPLK
jgi:hypothetical protein